MDVEELIGRIDVPNKTNMVADCTNLIQRFEISIDDLIEVSFHKKKEIAFRAAWMLEYIITDKPAEFYPFVSAFVRVLPKIQNQSVLRHYTKTLAMMTDRRSRLWYAAALVNINIDEVIEFLFTRLVDQKTLVASKVHCMQALANLAPQHGWIRAELEETIAHLTEVESYAFFARAKMVKKQMEKYC